MKRLILLALSFSLLGLSLIAQDQPAYQTTTNTSAYFYSGTIAGSEQLKIYTYIWGQVMKPGLYIVPDNTDLLTLMSLAGGPTENAKLAKIRIVRPVADDDRVIFVNIKEYLETGDDNLIPQLQPGDTIIVSGTIYYAFFRFTDFLSKIAIVISVATMLNAL
ncbi:MAG: SLBB domain-containing protein [Candidatus Cloacimonetes bacterium]|nr:SLBB domain-containing protein [Candidatus Cloacimonadota bacterium]